MWSSPILHCRVDWCGKKSPVKASNVVLRYLGFTFFPFKFDWMQGNKPLFWLAWHRHCAVTLLRYLSLNLSRKFFALLRYKLHKTLPSVTRWNELSIINHSSSSNKGNHGRDSVKISFLNWNRFLRFYFYVFSLVVDDLSNTNDSVQPNFICCFDKFIALRVVF